MRPSDNKHLKHRVKCQNCGRMISVIQGNEVTFAKNDRGSLSYPKVRIQHDAGGRFEVVCDCGATPMAINHKTLPMSYEIKKPTKKVDGEKPDLI